ncbi:uncharacterized protein H6S33_009320 [Morchella sextelata]|uniref:uncharacterized protein n=1 Tax=Morchella sextelata TaxID=1174677 RepID=UPI001D0582D0|nr:uncharacterized protein H6S33_009320 [Morchella sextelata]KAH0612940.1 hypothetical protein H6S33_009320 [Morchella sextelata]
MSTVDETETPQVVTDVPTTPMSKVEQQFAAVSLQNTGSEMTTEQCKERLQDQVKVKKLEAFYPEIPNELAEKAAKMVNELRAKGCSREMANQFGIMTLYDLAILIDDSDSMKYEENGERIKTLQKTLDNIANVYGLARDQGIITVRFLNAPQGKKNVTVKTVKSVLKNHNYGGVTRIGTELKKKILDRFVNKDMAKPLLIMIITDGAPEGEATGLLETVIINCISSLSKDGAKGPQSVAFQFSRVGNDTGAQKLIQDLDDHPSVGQYIDCLPMNNRLEDIKDKEKKWILLSKLLLGAISPYWDSTEEIENTKQDIEGTKDDASDVEDEPDSTPPSDLEDEEDDE